jgi:hypothetical protein
MTKEEFEKAIAGDKKKEETFKSEYTRIVRKDGALVAVPYHEAWPEQTRRAAAKLRDAAALATDKGLKKYLELRAKALETSDYRASDRAWLDMKDNVVDVVVGPIETYEDKLFGYKAAHEGYVLVKDQEWSKRLASTRRCCRSCRRGFPWTAAYKKEVPGTDSDLNAYDVVYYAGDCNAGSKTIAINLPNDETIQLEKGTRRLQLKNAMRAKFDTILVPIANILIAEDQRQHVTFDAFFADVMFHEVAHGLGIKKTIDGKGTVRDALKDQAGALEEGKADILGLHMITRLHEKGDLPEVALEDAYTTFLAGSSAPCAGDGQCPRPGEPLALPLLPEGGCLQPRRSDRHLPRGHAEDARRHGQALRPDPEVPGGRRLRRRGQVHGRAGEDGPGAAGRPGPRGQGRHPQGHRLRAGGGGAGPAAGGGKRSSPCVHASWARRSLLSSRSAGATGASTCAAWCAIRAEARFPRHGSRSWKSGGTRRRTRRAASMWADSPPPGDGITPSR